MSIFFTESKKVSVSYISDKGWWLNNATEHVVAGTALGDEFTLNLYTPSEEGKIAQYDRENNTWSDEIDDMTWKEYFDVNGKAYYVGEPDGEYPEGAITEAPPEYDSETETVLYENETWSVYKIRIGESYYDEYGNELKIVDYNFTIPDGFTDTAPPDPDEGCVVRLVAGEWTQVEDHRGETVWSKETGSASVVEELGAISEEYTTQAFIPYSVWDEETNAWVVTEEAAQQQITDVVSQGVALIDKTAETVTQKWTRFTEEYQIRESAALAYKEAGYTGEVSLYITSFADAAEMDYQAATDLILEQADNLRTLQSQIAAQRMAKNKLKQSGLTVAEITALRDDIVLNIQTLGDSYE